MFLLGSLSGGGRSVQRFLSRGLCPGESLSRGLCRETPDREPPLNYVDDRAVRIPLECCLVLKLCLPHLLSSILMSSIATVGSTISVDATPLKTSLCIGGSKGGRQGRAPPPGVQILSFSCSFRQKVEKIIPLWELAPPLRKILDPPLLCLLAEFTLM